MGTRSLLAVETKPDKYRVQYMQFDGYPDVKGLEYYAALIKALNVSVGYFSLKNGKPNKKMRDRMLTHLNEIQYQTGHSIGNQFDVDAKDWYKQDCWQEWQYLFKYNGDFEFFHTYGDAKYLYRFPWDLSYKMASVFHSELLADHGPKALTIFFEGNKWVPEDAKELLRLKLTMGERMAFPEQGDGGWRNFGTLYAVDGNMKEQIICESMFAKDNDNGGAQVRKLKTVMSTVEWG